MNNQKGSTHAIIIIGLVVALIGALGFVFWQNFIYEEPAAKETEAAKNESTKGNSIEDVEALKTYEDANFSFKYPDTWKVNYVSKDDASVDLVSNNFKASDELGVVSPEQGVKITVQKTAASAYGSIQNEHAQAAGNQGSVSAISNNKDGNPFFNYQSKDGDLREYYTVTYIGADRLYVGMYPSAADDTDENLGIYEDIISSLKKS